MCRLAGTGGWLSRLCGWWRPCGNTRLQSRPLSSHSSIRFRSETRRYGVCSNTSKARYFYKGSKTSPHNTSRCLILITSTENMFKGTVRRNVRGVESRIVSIRFTFFYIFLKYTITRKAKTSFGV